MQVRCAACQTVSNVADEVVQRLAGKNVKCPKCGVAFLLELPAGSTETRQRSLPRAKPLAAADQPTVSAPVPVPAPAPTAAPVTDLPVPRIEASSGNVRTRRSPRSAPSTRPVYFAAGGAAVTLLAVVAIVYLAAAGGRHSRVASQGGGGAASGGRAARSAEGVGIVELELSNADRASISLHVDGRKHPIPSSGDVRIEVPAGNRQLVLQRRGFEQQNVQMVVRAGERIVYQPKWAPLIVPEGGFGVSVVAAPLTPVQTSTAGSGNWDRWLQDYDLARRRAAESRKDVLLLFVGSDWSEASLQLARNVLLAEQFPQQVGSRYELVLLDFPQTVAQRRKVANPAGNVQLRRHFGVQGIPSLVLADEAGRPYAHLQYENGDFNHFMRTLEACRTYRVDRDDLFARVTASTGEAKLEALAQASQMLEQMDLESHYVPTFRQWYLEARQADPRNEQGYNEQFFFMYWNVALEHAARRELPRLPDVVRELDQWKQDHQFRDRDLAALLHLLAADYTSPQGAESIRQYAKAGLEYGPQDKHLRNKLTFLIERADSFDTLGSGAGFAVAERGLILTNFHVVEAAANVEAQIEGVEGHVPGKVVATDPQHDLALVQLEVADPDLLEPLQLSTRSIGRGVAVGAFGYPLGGTLGRGLILASGVVSATHEQTETGMMLLDCRINPGNSGGPLCIATGEVVGIVTAKSLAGRNEESYGMAVPAESIVKFLRQHLPDYEPPAAASVGLDPAGFDVVNQQISPSVVMLLAKRSSASDGKSPERQAAEWVLALGGSVGLELGDGSRFGVRDAEHLPQSEFRVVGIDLQGNNSVTDEGLAHLAQLQALVALGLNGTKISDAGLRHLTNVPTLRLLDLGDTAVTESGLAALRAALPGCEIRQ